MKPYFKQANHLTTPGQVAKYRLEQLEELRRQAAWYEKNPTETAPAYMETMKLIAKEAEGVQDRVAELIASAENLATLFTNTEEKLGEHQTRVEEEGSAGEDFTVSDAKALVDAAAKPIEEWKY